MLRLEICSIGCAVSFAFQTFHHAIRAHFLKKVCLCIFPMGGKTRKDLQQLLSFFFQDDDFDARRMEEHGGKTGSWRPRTEDKTYSDVNSSFHRCKGALMAVHEARDLTKYICCVSRDLVLEKTAMRLRWLRSNCLVLKLVRRIVRKDEHIFKMMEGLLLQRKRMPMRTRPWRKP